MTESRWYAVSTGNGNDGVSHMFPDYYVKTNDPWLLAHAAMISEWNDRWWAAENVEVDGGAEYNIQAVIYEGPEGETQFGAAEMLLDVFPVSDDELPDISDPWHKPMYESIEDAIDSTTLEIAKRD